MAVKMIDTTVVKCSIVSGRTVFEVETNSDEDFTKVAVENGEVFDLKPVHYNYIDLYAHNRRIYAIMGENDITGDHIQFIS